MSLAVQGQDPQWLPQHKCQIEKGKKANRQAGITPNSLHAHRSYSLLMTYSKESYRVSYRIYKSFKSGFLVEKKPSSCENQRNFIKSLCK